MHLLLHVLIVDGLMCVAGAAAMAYWAWRAVPDPDETAEMGFDRPFIELAPTPYPAVQSWKYWIIKRGIDLTAALLMLIAFRATYGAYRTHDRLMPA